MRALRTLWIAAALSGLSGCGEVPGGHAVDAATSISYAPDPIDPASPRAAPMVDIEPLAAADALAASLPPPPFDAEAEARAREQAERAAFEAEWPLHGIAYHFLAQIRARPEVSSPVIGYVRRGSRFRAKEGLRGAGCGRGWHEVVGGGFVCRGDGFLLGDRPQSFEPSPVPAALEDALPYPYAYVAREDAPQYWRIPSPHEELEAARVIDDLRAAAEARAATVAATTEVGQDALAPTSEPDLEAPPQLVAIASGASDAGVELGATDVAALPEFLRMRMLRGFYVSIDREESLGERSFFRTVRGAYVPSEVLAEAQPPAMRGVVIGGAWSPPIGFVFRRGVRALTRDPVSGALTQRDPVEVHTPLLLEDEVIERRGSRYRVTRAGLVVRESAIRIVAMIPRPSGIGELDRWIHVDLSEQTLVAYEGDRPVFTTLVSTGKPGFETPIGTFRIQSKHVSTTMDDPESIEGAYSIEDVPWAMYFEGSYALHGAFWHDSFGHVRSHGCVNLAPADARWIFQWSTPTLPPGWHGVIATSRRAGTWVHVTE
jgi:hypothetical protein